MRFNRILAVVVLLMTAAFAQHAGKAAPTPPQEDISGMYSFTRDGEFVQITIEPGEMPAPKPQPTAPEPSKSEKKQRTKLAVPNSGDIDAQKAPQKGVPVSGFISRYGDLASDKGVFLDQFFESGRLIGDEITFKTKALHGTWFEFSGHVHRGQPPTKAKEGYWVIEGTLTQHFTDENGKETAREREITMKSFPEGDDETQ